jgi:hypothetical protein
MQRWLVVSLAGVFGLVLILVLGQAAASGQGPADDGLERAIEVQELHTDALLNLPGIVGTGVGLNAAGKPVIKIYSERVPQGLPAALDSVPVEVVVTGRIVARACPDGPAGRCDRPVPVGVSTGHPDITAGTIGARVTNGTDVFALSNNHVYADSNNAAVGDSALQPGAVDGGANPGDAIGTLHSFEPIKFNPSACDASLGAADPDCNIMDAAIAISSTAMLGNATLPDGYGVPSAQTASASVGQQVKKYGRTTSLTSGQVAEINVTVNVCYAGFVVCTKVAKFVGQVSISPGSFSAGGDSGSLIVTQSDNRPVALLFAGSSSRTIGNPIGPVLSRFSVTIDGSAPAATATATATATPTATPTPTATATPGEPVATSTPTATPTATPAPLVCTAPTLSGTDSNSTGGGTVFLAWTSIPGAANYRLQRRDLPNGNWKNATTTSTTSWSGSESREREYRVRVQTGTCAPVPGPYSSPFNP